MTSSGRTEVGSDTEREEERALEEQGAEQHLEDLERGQEEIARIEEAIARDEHEREISDRTPEGGQGRVTWNVRVETTGGEHVADIAHHHWHMKVWMVKKAIDDAAINEGRKWANKCCLLIDDTEKDLKDDDQLRRATRPRRNIIYKLVIRDKRRIGLSSMARPDGTWGVRGQWSSELSWLRNLGEEEREEYRQQVQKEKLEATGPCSSFRTRNTTPGGRGGKPQKGPQSRGGRESGERKPNKLWKREKHGRRGIS